MLLQRRAEKGDKFGNSQYSVDFGASVSAPSTFGEPYMCCIQDAVDHAVEYVVHWERFAELAGEYGLGLVSSFNFDTMLAQHKDSDVGKALMSATLSHLPAPQQSSFAISKDEQETAGLFRTFTFVKLRDTPPMESSEAN